jgi:hypothetical protein
MIMKRFAIDAYGGKDATDGAVHHFTVQAETLVAAIELIKESAGHGRYVRFDVVEDELEIEGEEAAILEGQTAPIRDQPKDASDALSGDGFRPPGSELRPA